MANLDPIPSYHLSPFVFKFLRAVLHSLPSTHTRDTYSRNKIFFFGSESFQHDVTFAATQEGIEVREIFLVTGG